MEQLRAQHIDLMLCKVRQAPLAKMEARFRSCYNDPQASRWAWVCGVGQS